MELYVALVGVVRQALFWVGAAAAVIALVDWLVRTRRINPFGPVAQFFRKFVDPLMRPVEARIVRAGGQPSSAPWWTLVFVVVGGLIAVSLLQFVAGLARQASYAMDSPGGAWRVAVAWTFGLLRLALLIRVVSSWFGISPYSKYVRWTFGLTEWMLAPLRRMLPAFGPVDISPLLAFLLLGLLQSVLT
ncbi:MAG: YggT family protein [Gemmatimonadota bacterium]